MNEEHYDCKDFLLFKKLVTELTELFDDCVIAFVKLNFSINDETLIKIIMASTINYALSSIKMAIKNSEQEGIDNILNISRAAFEHGLKKLIDEISKGEL
jgi:hypothetical protein